MKTAPVHASFPILALALVSSCGSGSSCRTSGLRGASAPSAAPPRITPAFIPKGRFARHRIRHMRPRYITIHSTQEFAAGADARAHADLLRRGALKGRKNAIGYISWHYTVDDHSVHQSLPDNEQGQHADYEGRGNRQSIGVEMCENRDGDLEATIDRTARLTAHLMKKHRIPIRRVVPHQHWRRIRHADGRDLGHKNCPHFLMTNGRPGPKWNAFRARVKCYRDRL